MIVTNNVADLSATAIANTGFFAAGLPFLPIGASYLFAFDNGTDSAIYRWQEIFGDQFVQAIELSLVTYLEGTAQLATTDFLFV